MESRTYRILARELAIEEVELVSGAVTGPGDDGQSDQMGDAGSGCTMPDDSFLTIYDNGRDFTRMQ